MIHLSLDSIKAINGAEGTQIKQIFHPHNTILGIRYSMIKCTIAPHKRSKKHMLKSSEVYFIIKGSGMVYVDDESKWVKENESIYIPPHSKQFIENIGDIDLEFLCIVDPAWTAQDEIVIEQD